MQICPESQSLSYARSPYLYNTMDLLPSIICEVLLPLQYNGPALLYHIRRPLTSTIQWGCSLLFVWVLLPSILSFCMGLLASMCEAFVWASSPLCLRLTVRPHHMHGVHGRPTVQSGTITHMIYMAGFARNAGEGPVRFEFYTDSDTVHLRNQSGFAITPPAPLKQPLPKHYMYREHHCKQKNRDHERPSLCKQTESMRDPHAVQREGEHERLSLCKQTENMRGSHSVQREKEHERP